MCDALVFTEDQAALATLLAEARRRAAADVPTDEFVRVRHACGAMDDAIPPSGGKNTMADNSRALKADNKKESHMPVEIKACGDGTYAFCVLLDARMPARLEGLLPNFLLSTSASRPRPIR